MCGITGFVGPGDRSDLEAMTRALAHRGPDGEGYYEDQAARVFLGHRRLAIIDIAGGHQPMPNEDNSVFVVFNGEIYNHASLRKELVTRGHRFRSDHSDTEILVHGYEEWGEDLPLRLNGMFAFAIYDKARRRIFLARDRFGEKPLYYFAKPGIFVFASELTGVITHPRSSPSLDFRSLQKFFAHGYLPAPNALYEHCRKLPGGCQLIYDATAETISIKRYWQFSLEPDGRLTEADDDRLASELRALLIQAVDRRLMSDVPLGLFLSGGIDSASVLGAVTKLRGRESVDTFTIGFTERSFDESANAQRIAEFLGSRHHNETLDLSRADELIPAVLSNMDEPLGDGSVIPTFLLCRFARKSVKVALSGDGGDELFAGYDPFMALSPAKIYDQFVPTKIHSLIRRFAHALPISTGNMSFDFKLRRTLAGLSYPRPLWNPIWLSPLEPRDMREIFQDPLSPEELYGEVLALWNASEGKDLVDRTLEFFTNFYLQDDILTKVDRAAMMNSLETRAIFLDNDLVEFCRRLPNRFKFRRGQRKYLLRLALRGLVPETVLVRPKKGFGIPLSKWLKTIPVEPPLAPVKGVRMERVRERWVQHRAGTADQRLFLWSWLALQATLHQTSADMNGDEADHKVALGVA
jgi:asparagine synthase (glutamine-hydrolysing)